MQRVVTLPERKSAEAVRRAEAVQALMPVLAEYARQHGGRFLLFGSAARGAMKFDSDVDVLVDFPPEALQDAWGFAETACWERGLLPYRWCKPEFLTHVVPTALVLG